MEFTKKKVATINIRLPINEEDIKHLMELALDEGGINHWADIDDSGPLWENKPVDISRTIWATKLLLDRKEVTLYDIKKTKEELEQSKHQSDIADKGYWTLTLDKLIKGIGTYVTYNENNFNKDKWDTGTADYAFQYALFDRLVFA